MINTKFLLLASACVLLSSSSQASEAENLTFSYSGSLLVNTYTLTPHTPMELKPISSLDNLAKLAAVCALGGGGCSGMSFGSSGNSMDLDKNSQCTDEGFVKVCPSGYVKDDNNLCPHNKSYFKCKPCSNTCDSGYSLTACNSTTQVQTASYKNTCTNTCYQCRYKTCAEGGYAASLTSCQNGTAVSFANKTCYKNVTAKTCENGGYKSSVPTNNKCTAVTYCSKTCQSNCYQPTCEEGGYKFAVPTNNVCTDVTYYGRTCKKDCYQPTCDYNNSGYKSGVPTNQVCSPVTYYGRSCYKDCYQPQCTAGGYVSTCPTNQIGTSVTYYGRNCYQNCYQPTCEEGGYKSAVPANNVCTDVTYYGRTCKKDCYQPTCEQGGYLSAMPTDKYCYPRSYYGRSCYSSICYEVQPVLYSDMTVIKSNTPIPGKTPIGIVFDTNKRLAVALKPSPSELEWDNNPTNYVQNISNWESCKFTYDNEIDSCGTNGKENTAKILAYAKTISFSYPAVEYANQYTTPGTKAGDWFLPSLSELKSIDKSNVDITLDVLGISYTTTKVYLSSTRFYTYDTPYSYIIKYNNASFFTPNRDDGYVLPIIQY